MRMVRDREDARWLPSRYRYALFRLLAYGMFRAKGPTPKAGIVITIDRDQTALESYAMAIWLTFVSSCFAIAILTSFVSVRAALFVGPPVAVIALQAFTSIAAFAGTAWPDRNSVGIISFLTIFLVAAAALHVAGGGGWPRYVAWTFLGTLAANAVAAVVAYVMRGRFLDAEREAGAA